MISVLFPIFCLSHSSDLFIHFSGVPGVPPGPNSGGNHVLLKDVGHLVRLNMVAVPSGFTKLGHPLLYFPDISDHENTNGQCCQKPLISAKLAINATFTGGICLQFFEKLFWM